MPDESTPQVAGATGPTVGVVIPTTGRDALRRSVQSALAQTRPPQQVVVVVDAAPQRVGPDDLPADHRIETVATGGGLGAAGARNTGVARLRTDLVAFLDDDDRWAPTKLERQVAAVVAERARGAAHVVVTCRQLVVDDDGRLLDRWPRRVIAPGERVGDYLFTRRQVRPGETTMSASMVLCDLDLARQVPFTGESVHEDWAWLLHVGARPGCRVVGLDEDLVHYTLSAAPSASSAIGWRESSQWVLGRDEWVGARQRGDFLLTVTAPLALHGGDLSGLREVVRTARRRGAPGWAAYLFLALLTVRTGARAALRGLRRGGPLRPWR